MRARELDPLERALRTERPEIDRSVQQDIVARSALIQGVRGGSGRYTAHVQHPVTDRKAFSWQ